MVPPVASTTTCAFGIGPPSWLLPSPFCALSGATPHTSAAAMTVYCISRIRIALSSSSVGPAGQCGGVQDLFDLFIREDVPLAHDLENALATLEGFGRQLRCLVVPDHGIQRRHRPDARLEIVLADLRVGRDPIHAVHAQRARGIHEQRL